MLNEEKIDLIVAKTLEKLKVSADKLPDDTSSIVMGVFAPYITLDLKNDLMEAATSLEIYIKGLDQVLIFKRESLDASITPEAQIEAMTDCKLPPDLDPNIKPWLRRAIRAANNHFVILKNMEIDQENLRNAGDFIRD